MQECTDEGRKQRLAVGRLQSPNYSQRGIQLGNRFDLLDLIKVQGRTNEGREQRLAADLLQRLQLHRRRGIQQRRACVQHIQTSSD